MRGVTKLLAQPIVSAVCITVGLLAPASAAVQFWPELTRDEPVIVVAPRDDVLRTAGTLLTDVETITPAVTVTSFETEGTGEQVVPASLAVAAATEGTAEAGEHLHDITALRQIVDDELTATAAESSERRAAFEQAAENEGIGSVLEVRLTRETGEEVILAEDEFHFETGSVVLALEPKRQFTPGTYTITATINDPVTGEIVTISQDANWGVLAANFNQDRYQPGEAGELAIGVLDSAGAMVCGAAVKVTITAPDQRKHTLTTQSGIDVLPSCHEYDSRLTQPDYRARYTFADPGDYLVAVTATTAAGTRTTRLTVPVIETPPVVITRHAATRLYPVGRSPMSLTVTFNEDFAGHVVDVLPASFIITQPAYADDPAELPFIVVTNEAEGTKKIIWEGSWEAGEVAKLYYEYDAPNVSPEFYLVGPASLYEEAQLASGLWAYEQRAWHIANDAVAYPGGVSDSLQLWYKASDGVYSDGGSTLATDGDSVQQWQDQGPNSNNVNQTTGGNQPTFQNDTTNNVNNNPIVLFDGSNDFLESTYDLGADVYPDLTFISVYQPSADPAGAPWGNDDAGWDRFILDLAALNNAVSTGPGGTPANNSTGVTGLFTTSNPTLATVQYDEDATNGSYVRVNGKSELTFTAGHGPQTDGNFDIGHDGDDNKFTGAMPEVIAYGDLLTPAERGKVETYLAIKYGLTLSTDGGGTNGDYSSSGDVTLWDASANNTYHNDVAGIGQDDDSGLDQITSKSENASTIVQIGSATSQANNDFLVWGNNNQNASGWTGDDVALGFERLGSSTSDKIEWRATETNDIGTVTITVAESDLPASPALTSTNPLYVLIDTDDDTSLADEVPIVMTDAGSNTWSYSHSFENGGTNTEGQEFSFAQSVNVPTSISGIKLWLDATDASTVHENTSCTDTAEVDIDTVACWEDKTTNNADVTQSTSSQRPDYKSDQFNSLNAVEFSRSSSDYLSHNVTDWTSDHTVFVAFMQRTNPGTYWSFFSNGNPASGDHFQIDNVDGTPDNFRINRPGDNVTFGDTVLNELQLFTVRMTDADDDYVDDGSSDLLEIFDDGELVDSDNDNDGNDLQGSLFEEYRLNVNRNHDQFNDSTIAEVIIYDRNLTDCEMAVINEYLGEKYGVDFSGIAAQYDYTASYGNDVVGLGHSASSTTCDPAVVFSESGGSSVLSMSVSAPYAANHGLDMTNQDEYASFGHDNGSLATESTEIPSAGSYTKRLNRVWRIDHDDGTGSDHFNNLNVVFDASSISTISSSDLNNPNNFALLLDTDGTFTDATMHTEGLVIDTSAETITFTGVDFSDGDYITLASEGPSTAPGGVETDLAMWLRADRGVSPSSGTVTSWTDQTGTNTFTVNGNPQTGATTLNSNNVIDFDGDSDYFDGNTTIDLRTVYAVFQDSAQAGDVLFGPNQSTAGSTRGYFWRYISDAAYMGDDDSDPDYVHTASAPPSGYFLYTAEKKGGSNDTDSRIAFNGADQTLTSHGDGDPLGQHTDSPRLGRGSDPNQGTGVDFTGNVAEIIVYGNTSLSDSNEDRVHSYLALKYGITLDQTTAQSYYDSGGNEILDADGTFDSYDNDIAGIGKDNASLLDQTTSQSINSDSIVKVSSASSLEDGDFLVWGNDNGSLASVTRSNTPSGVPLRLPRIWRVDETNSVGTVTLEFNLSSLDLPFSAATDFKLLKHTGTDFSGVTPIDADSFSSSTVTFNNVDFADNNYFTLGFARGVPGGKLFDLQLWLKGNAGVVHSSNAISSWQDQSGHTRHFVQGTSANQPTNTSNAINFNNAPVFDGSNDFLEDADGESYINGAGSYSSFTAIDSDSADVDGYIFNTDSAASLSEAPWGLRYDDAGAESSHNNTLKTGIDTTGTKELYEADAANLTKATAQVASVEWQSGSAPTFQVDGTTIDSYTSPAQSGTLTGADYVRIGDDANMDYWDGAIGELVFYDTAFGTADEQRIASYLATKYGTTLSSDIDNDGTSGETVTGSVTEGDYVLSDSSTVVWDYSANTSYHHDVAGLLQDDGSALDQTSSRSENSDSLVTMSAASSQDDGDALFWGNDNGATTKQDSDVSATIGSRLTRIWRVDETNSVGTVTVQFDVSSLNLKAGSASSYYLLTDTDTTLANATQQVANSFDGDTVTFNAVDFSDGQYFSLGVQTSYITLTLSNPGPSDSAQFGTLSTQSVAATSSATLTVSTNASSGYTVKIQSTGDSSTAGLYSSAGAGHVISSGNSTLAAGTEGFGVQASSGTATIDADFDGTGNEVGVLSLTAATLASNTTTVQSEQVTVTYKAAISSTTPAGDYRDTVYYTISPNL